MDAGRAAVDGGIAAVERRVGELRACLKQVEVDVRTAFEAPIGELRARLAALEARRDELQRAAKERLEADIKACFRTPWAYAPRRMGNT